MLFFLSLALFSLFLPRSLFPLRREKGDLCSLNQPAHSFLFRPPLHFPTKKTPTKFLQKKSTNQFAAYLTKNNLTAEQLLASPDLKWILKQHFVKKAAIKGRQEGEERGTKERDGEREKRERETFFPLTAIKTTPTTTKNDKKTSTVHRAHQRRHG